MDADRSTASRGAAPPVSKAEVIRRGVVRAILEHRLGPGVKLGEDEIGSVYGVSRTIVRSALQALAQEGILVLEKNRGAFVAHPTAADAREVFEARRLIEGATAALAAGRCDGAAARRLRAHVEAEQRAAAAGDEPTAIRLSGEFHLEVARIAGHRTYEDFLRELVARSSLIIMIYRRARDPGCRTDHHDRLVAAIESGRIGEAVDLMDHHLADLVAALDLADRDEATDPLAKILAG